MIGMIVAHDLLNAIGNGGELPWHSTEDLNHFKETTMGGLLVMGRETAESIGKPLPGRECVVLSKDPEYFLDGFTTMTPESLTREWLVSISNGRYIWIVGGGSIYDQCLDFADKVIVSLVRTEVDAADTYFPQYRGWLAMSADLIHEPYKEFAPTEKCPYHISVYEYVA